MSKVEMADLQRQVLALTEALARMTGDQVATTFGEFALGYQTMKLSRSDLREATKRSFEYNVRSLLIPAFGHLPIDKIDVRVWLAWVAKIIDSSVKMLESRYAKKDVATMEGIVK